jgi:hypothetical protein
MNPHEMIFNIGLHHGGRHAAFWGIIGAVSCSMINLLIIAIAPHLSPRCKAWDKKGGALPFVSIAISVVVFTYGGFFLFRPMGKQLDAQEYTATMQKLLQLDFTIHPYKGHYVVYAPTPQSAHGPDDLMEPITLHEALDLRKSLLASTNNTEAREGNLMTHAWCAE